MKNVKILAVVLALFLGCPTVQSVGSDNGTKVRNGVLLGIGVGISALCLKYLYDYCTAPYTSDQLLELIITNPAKVASYVEKIYSTYKIIESCEKLSYDSFFELLQKCEQACPICLLGECTADFCEFSRCNNPEFRECFESKTVAAINEKLKGGKPVNYVGFGSGSMLQDLIIIAKVLTKNPTAQININLIDQKYENYTLVRDYLKNGREVKEGFDDVLAQESYKEAFEKAKRVYDEGTRKEIICVGMAAKQFLSMLKQAFPEAKLMLALYASGDDFVGYVEANKQSYPDVIAAADIQDDVSYCCGGVPAYMFFSLYINSKKPSSINLWLCRNVDIGVGSLSIDKVEGATDQGGTIEFFKKSRKPNDRPLYAKEIDSGWMTFEKIETIKNKN